MVDEDEKDNDMKKTKIKNTLVKMKWSTVKPVVQERRKYQPQTASVVLKVIRRKWSEKVKEIVFHQTPAL